MRIVKVKKLNIVLDIVLYIEDMNLNRVEQLLAIDIKVYESCFIMSKEKSRRK